MEFLKRITFDPEIMGGEALSSRYAGNRWNDRWTYSLRA